MSSQSPKRSPLTDEQREKKRKEIEERVKKMLSQMESPRRQDVAETPAPKNEGSAPPKREPSQSAIQNHSQVAAKIRDIKERVEENQRNNVQNNFIPADDLILAVEAGASTATSSSSASPTALDAPAVGASRKIHPSALPSNDSQAVSSLRAKLHMAKSDEERLRLAIQITAERFPLSHDEQRERKAAFDKQQAERKAQIEQEVATKMKIVQDAVTEKMASEAAATQKAAAEKAAAEKAAGEKAAAEKAEKAAADKAAAEKAAAEKAAAEKAEKAAAEKAAAEKAAAEKAAAEKAAAEKAAAEKAAAEKAAAEKAAAVEAFPSIEVHEKRVGGVVVKAKSARVETAEEASARRKRAEEERVRAEREAEEVRKETARRAAAEGAHGTTTAKQEAKSVTAVEVSSEALAAQARQERDLRRKREEEEEKLAKQRVLEKERAARREAFLKTVSARSVEDASPSKTPPLTSSTSRSDLKSTVDVLAEVKQQTDVVYAKLEQEALANVKLDLAASERERQRAVEARQQRELERKTAAAAAAAARAKREEAKLSSSVDKISPAKSKSAGTVAVPKKVVDVQQQPKGDNKISLGMWIVIVALAFFVLSALAR